MNQAEPESPDPKRIAALERMKKDVGEWSCRWEFLDSDGNVVSTTEGKQSIHFALPDSIVIIKIEAPEIGSSSITQRFYDPQREKIVWISVNQEGDLWTFIEDAEDGFSISLPHKNEDGTVTSLRFSQVREAPGEEDVLMESSSDETIWTPIFKMCRKRI